MSDSDKVRFVDYHEPISIKVGRFLLSKGFDIASSEGIETRSLVEGNSLGILLRNPKAKLRTYLFGLLNLETQRRRNFPGAVYFSNGPHGANDQNWVFEVYGRTHVELIRQLAEEMASTFNVKITLHLMREDPAVETYSYNFTC